MLPNEHTTIDHMTIDLAGELANMVIGDAKRQREDKGLRFEVLLPVMIVGEKHLIAHKSTEPVISVPFTMDEALLLLKRCTKNDHKPLSKTLSTASFLRFFCFIYQLVDLFLCVDFTPEA